MRTLKKKIKKDLRATFVVTYNTTKLSYDARTKDRVANLCTFLLVYRFCCPGCSENYICKSGRTFFEKLMATKLRTVQYTTVLITV